MLYASNLPLAAKVTGLPALLIILGVLALIIIGIFTVIRAAGRKAKDKL